MTTETTAEQPQFYYFTFGSEIPALEHRYVRVWGTWMETRQRVLAVYGFRFCEQYCTPDVVEQYHLTELVVPALQETTDDD